MTVDDRTVQLVWDRLLALVEEQAQTLMRTAFSTVVREAGDLSAGVFDREGRMLAQAVTGTPGHVNAMAASVGKFLKRYPLERLADGDVLITNDPWDGTGHLNDFTVVTPAFQEGHCVALFAATSHIADVGGRGFGPEAAELYEEGIRIPIMPLFHRGQRNEALMQLLAANVRDPLVAEGDLYSLTACNEAGAKRLLTTLREFGLKDLDAVGEEILHRSRRAMMRAVEALPDGRWQDALVIDGYDEPLELRCELIVAGAALKLDFSGSPPASDKGINVPLPYTDAYASFGVRCLIGGDIPNNQGSLEPIEVCAEAGSLLAAQPPSAVSARHAVGQMLPDLVLGCMAQVLPGQVPSEGASCIWNPVLRGADFVINPIFNGGTGARPRSGKDGLSTTAFPSGVRTTSTEVNEVTSPLVFWRRELAVGSAGVGALHGGLGQVLEIEHRYGQPFTLSRMFDRVQHAAAGRAGGGAGAPGRVEVYGPNGSRSLPGKGLEAIAAGERLFLQTPGGGGYGPATERSAERIRADRDAGLTALGDEGG